MVYCNNVGENVYLLGNNTYMLNIVFTFALLTQNKLYMKKIYTILFVVLTTISLSAQNIEQGTLKIFGYGTPGTNEYYELYGIDFNNDNLPEFYIQNDYSMPANDSAYVLFSGFDVTMSSNNNILTQGEYPDQDKVENLPLNTVIGETPGAGCWCSAMDANLCNLDDGLSFLTAGSDNYIGFKFSFSTAAGEDNLNTDVYYGWANVTMSGNTTTGYTFTWNKACYNSIAGASINAGDTGSAAPTDCLPVTGINCVVNSDNTVAISWTAAVSEGTPTYEIYVNDSMAYQTTYLTWTTPVYETGTYTVKIKTLCPGAGSDFSAPSTFTISDTTGVDEFAFDFSVFPNPADNVLNFSASAKIDVVEILSVNGQVVSSFDVDGFDFSVDISNIEQGTYFVRTLSDNSVSTKRIYIQ